MLVETEIAVYFTDTLLTSYLASNIAIHTHNKDRPSFRSCPFFIYQPYTLIMGAKKGIF